MVSVNCLATLKLTSASRRAFRTSFKVNIQGEVSIATESPVGNIRYTTDGTEPGLTSQVYEKPERSVLRHE